MFIGSNKKNENGVISLEACIVIPIFVFLIIFVYGFILFFSGQQLISHAVIQSSESLSLDSYATEKVNLSDEDEISSDEVFAVLYGKAMQFDSENFSSSKKWYNDSSTVPQTAKDRFVGFLSDGDTDEANDLLENFGIVGGLNGLDFSSSRVENGKLIINIKYKQEFIFNFQGYAAFDREITHTSKMWGI